MVLQEKSSGKTDGYSELMKRVRNRTMHAKNGNTSTTDSQTPPAVTDNTSKDLNDQVREQEGMSQQVSNGGGITPFTPLSNISGDNTEVGLEQTQPYTLGDKGEMPDRAEKLYVRIVDIWKRYSTLASLSYNPALGNSGTYINGILGPAMTRTFKSKLSHGRYVFVEANRPGLRNSHALGPLYNVGAGWIYAEDLSLNLRGYVFRFDLPGLNYQNGVTSVADLVKNLDDAITQGFETALSQLLRLNNGEVLRGTAYYKMALTMWQMFQQKISIPTPSLWLKFWTASLTILGQGDVVPWENYFFDCINTATGVSSNKRNFFPWTSNAALTPTVDSWVVTFADRS